MPAGLLVQVVICQALAFADPAAQPPPAPVAPSAEQKPAEPASPAKEELREVVLTLRDGRVFTGFLVRKTDTQFIIRIAEIDTPFESRQVESYRLLEPVLERYRALRAAIADDDVQQLLELADFLASRDQLQLAYNEVEALSKRVPKHEAVQRKLTILAMQLEFQHQRGQDNQPTRQREAETPRQAALLLTPEQQNLIKVYELDLATRPPVVVPRSVSEAFVKKYVSHPLVPVTKEGRDAIIAEGGVNMVDLIFRVRAREFYPQIKVQQTPQTLSLFREEIHKPLLLAGCATSGCHGTVGSGRFVLATQRPLSEAAALTNFYIISKYRTDDGKALVDFDSPERSVLLQMALPREQSSHPHPVAPSAETGLDRWRPIIRTADDRRFKQTVAWIRSLQQPRPVFDLDYMPIRPFEPQADRATKPKEPAK